MGREHTFLDRRFGRPVYDPEDQGGFEEGLVSVVMPCHGQGMTDAYAATRDECKNLQPRAKRVDEGSGPIIREITDLIERSEFIVRGLTNERPNVHYALGYGRGVGNEAMDILSIAKYGTIFHVDIAPLRVQFYSQDGGGSNRLSFVHGRTERTAGEKIQQPIQSTSHRTYAKPAFIPTPFGMRGLKIQEMRSFDSLIPAFSRREKEQNA